MSAASSKQVMIRKASGELEAFIPGKLAASLRSAGADEELVDQILTDIRTWLTNGVSTRKIYARALSMLGRKRKAARSRYRIKDALMELGTSGYPFETYIGELFKKLGYEVQVGVVVDGAAPLTHEMDVIATGKGRQLLLECKYSQKQDSYVSVQVPLYVHSRVNDIIARRASDARYSGLNFTGGVVTNTRFSSDSSIYARHYGLELLSWDYPRGEALKDLIDRFRLYPVTILTSISPGIKAILMREGIVSCEQLAGNQSILNSLNMADRKYRALETELKSVLHRS